MSGAPHASDEHDVLASGRARLVETFERRLAEVSTSATALAERACRDLVGGFATDVVVALIDQRSRTLNLVAVAADGDGASVGTPHDAPIDESNGSAGERSVIDLRHADRRTNLPATPSHAPATDLPATDLPATPSHASEPPTGTDDRIVRAAVELAASAARQVTIGAGDGAGVQLIAIPLHHNGTLVGVLGLRRRMASFTDAELLITEQLATVLAAQLDEAGAFERLRRNLARGTGIVESSRSLFRAAFESSPMPTAVVGAEGTRIEQANQAFAALCGSGPNPARTTPFLWAAVLGLVDRLDIEVAPQVVVGGIDDRWFRLAVTAVDDEDGLALLQVVDLTEEHRNLRSLEAALERDDLTGLYRSGRLIDAIARDLAAEHYGGALLYLDVDEFKQVNDHCGHAAGDEVLIELARRLLQACRPGDTVSRLGGDEFALYAPSTGEGAAEAMADRVRAATEGPVLIGERSLPIRVSIGAATTSADTVSAVDILQEADRAMYHDKFHRRRQHR
ncbi:MAG TPA: diguanylate cyclase [Microthrixaceae bacterium]|nr:diguanylate cyclase [Microthrixaceae bacterium]